MRILCTILGCLLGVLFYKVLVFFTPLGSMGDWSIGILVAMCLIGSSLVGSVPWLKR